VVFAVLADPEILLVLSDVEQLVTFLASDPEVGRHPGPVAEGQMRSLEMWSIFEKVAHGRSAVNWS
jgi:hypothetical protein